MTLPVKDETEAMETAEELIRAIRLPVTINHIQVDISGSIGISISSEDSDSDELLRHADVALYEAKAAGRNCIRLFDPEMERRLLENKQIEADLKKALANKEMEVHYQPVVDLADFRIKGFEALLRWHHPVNGSVPPSLFIPIAETSHSISPITEWVLMEVLHGGDALAGRHHGRGQYFGRPADRPDSPNVVSDTLLKSGLPPRRLHLEITETALLADDPDVRYVLDMLKRIGTSLSLDDFGTGFSSLSHLCRYRFDSIKIDRSFLNNVESRSESRAVIQAASGPRLIARPHRRRRGHRDVRAAAICREAGLLGRPGLFLRQAHAGLRRAALSPRPRTKSWRCSPRTTAIAAEPTRRAKSRRVA